MAKNKYYTVWAGHNIGVYDSWAECQLQIKGFPGAKFKGFETREEAEYALEHHYSEFVGQKTVSGTPVKKVVPDSPEIIQNSIAVDAACSGNPGKMEYRGVHVASGQEIFHFGPIFGTNNIGEFLAIVHALALSVQKGWNMPVYSDSVNAQLWVKHKKCKTKLERNEKSQKVFEMIDRAEKWLANNKYNIKILKWETDKWGEIPADFGRK